MEVKPNNGVLFKNDRKTEERHPDYTGSITLEDGLDYYLDGWKNESKSGKSYLKVRIGKQKIQASNAAAPTAPIQKAAPAAAFESDDDIPF